MRKIIVLLLCIISLLLASCGTDNGLTESNEQVTETIDPEAQQISDELSAALPISCSVTVTMKDDGPSIKVSVISTSSLTYFGTRVYEAVNVCNEVMGEQDFSLKVDYYSDGTYLLFDYWGTSSCYGYIADNRPGDMETTMLETVDDLAEMFPVLYQAINLDQSGVSDEDIALYDLFMEHINDTSKTEDEIIEELSNEYNMSVDEINWFLRYMMEAKYSGIKQEELDYSGLRAQVSEPDPIIYTTSASENGYGGSIFYIVGEVAEFQKYDVYSIVRIKTEYGDYTAMLSDELIDEMSTNTNGCSFGWESWHSMDIGGNVVLYSYYLGYSDVFDCASGTFLGVEDKDAVADIPEKGTLYTNLGITLTDLVQIVQDEKSMNLEDFETCETENFTISKEGLSSEGTVAFCEPGQDKISVVFFLSYSGSNSSAYHRKEAKAATDKLKTYFETTGISVNQTCFEVDGNYVYCTSAADTNLSIDSLPITIRQYRNPNEFFADTDRVEAYQEALLSADYSSILSLLEEFESAEGAIIDERFLTVKEKAESLVSLVTNCTVTLDPIDSTATIQVPAVSDLSENICIVPTLETSKYGASVTCKIGFRRSGWLFFTKVSTNIDGEVDSFEYKYSSVNRNVISGSYIEEYAFTSHIQIKEKPSNFVIQFENPDTQEKVNHVATEDEIEAMLLLREIASLHSNLRSLESIYEDM